jgi:hypothetical protein
MLEGVERIVVDENPDGPLHWQQVRRAIYCLPQPIAP